MLVNVTNMRKGTRTCRTEHRDEDVQHHDHAKHAKDGHKQRAVDGPIARRHREAPIEVDVVDAN